MIKNTGIARELGYLHIDAENIIDAFDAGDLPPEKIVILSTGSQGEPLSALARMANGDHRTAVTIETGDTVIISASPVPGNEKAVSRVINRLAKAGAEVFHKGVADVHVSGHAAAEELKLMLTMAQPRFFMPVHGETRHLVAHARLAKAVGMAEEDIFVMDNGDCLEISENGARLRARPRPASSTSTACTWATSATWSCATASSCPRTASRPSSWRSTSRRARSSGSPSSSCAACPWPSPPR